MSHHCTRALKTRFVFRKAEGSDPFRTEMIEPPRRNLLANSEKLLRAPAEFLPTRMN